MTERVKSKIWVQAFIRQQEVDGRIALVSRSGDPDAGAVFVKHYMPGRGAVVYAPVTDADGAPAWYLATGIDPVSERDADAYLARQSGYDQDLWVVEVEDPKGSFEIKGRVIDP